MTEEKEYPALLKLVIAGDVGVGKTSLCMSFAGDANAFLPSVDFFAKKITVNGREVKLQIWDNPGQNQSSISRSPRRYAGVYAVLLVYDVTSKESFEHIRLLDQEVDRQNKGLSKSVKKVLIGNKIDLTDLKVVEASTGQCLAEELGMTFFECSTKSHEIVLGVFTEIARQFIIDAACDPIMLDTSSPKERCW
jgi:small GTP-binding protein